MANEQPINRKEKKELWLFDFDGTLTKGDTLLPFLLFALGKKGLLYASLKMIFPLFRLMFSRKINKGTIKEALIGVCFAGQSRKYLFDKGQAFCVEQLPNHIGRCIQHFHDAVKAGHHVVVVSASLDIWLLPFVKEFSAELICTQLEFENDVFTGRFAVQNCNGAEKARRIRAIYDLSCYDTIVAFGNSKGDREMLQLANRAIDANKPSTNR